MHIDRLYAPATYLDRASLVFSGRAGTTRSAGPTARTGEKGLATTRLELEAGHGVVWLHLKVAR
jgi:hypothetical protein